MDKSGRISFHFKGLENEHLRMSITNKKSEYADYFNQY